MKEHGKIIAGDPSETGISNMPNREFNDYKDTPWTLEESGRHQ